MGQSKTGHAVWMKRALELAQRGGDRTRPNPLVGALVVQNGQVRGEGYHAYFGGPHAEVLALRRAGNRGRGATLYTTLEPCSTWGKTPPCVDAVVTSGIKRVVIGKLDPNPQNHLQGVRKLRRAGVRVEVGISGAEVEKQNEPFFKVMRTGLPYVTLKMAQSLDGKIATRTGESRWISSPASRRLVYRLRQSADAVLIGKNTALQDDPALSTFRDQVTPWRVVLDPALVLNSKARIFKGPQLTCVVVSEKKLRRALSQLHPRKGMIFIPVPETKGKLRLKTLLQRLATLGIQQLLVEGGGEVAWSLIQEGLVDRLIWIVAPKIIGGRNAKTSVEGEGIKRITRAFPLRWEKQYRLGPDFVFEGRLCLQES